MRVKNKEIRRRRHRKEQKVKEAAKAVRLQFADKKPSVPAQKPKSAPTRKTATSKASDTRPRTPRPKKAETA